MSTIETSLTAISCIDGRYSSYTDVLSEYFSEAALIKKRIFVEIEYLIKLIFKIHPVNNLLKEFTTPYCIKYLKDIYNDFSIEDAILIKEIEKETNHEIKSIEYFIRQKCLSCDKMDMNNLVSFIHFGLTSSDINSMANALLLKDCICNVYIPRLTDIIRKLNKLGGPHEQLAFPTYTHGQISTPSTFYKELLVFIDRLDTEHGYLLKYIFFAKFGGTNGNCNVHQFVYGDIDWTSFFNLFLNENNIGRQEYTTQIEHYDNIAKLFDHLKRINTILIDLCQDIGLYISKDLIQLNVIEPIVKSNNIFFENAEEIEYGNTSHKVNPILFENAEGNLKLANSLLEFMSSKLPVSRMQRDLTDSTITRNYGTAFGYILIAFNNILKGLSKIKPNTDTIDKELNNYIVLAEPVKYYLKSKGIHNAYQFFKDFAKNKYFISEFEYIDFIYSLHQKLSKQLTDNDIQKLLELKPDNYVGYH